VSWRPAWATEGETVSKDKMKPAVVAQANNLWEAEVRRVEVQSQF
jgi:hypothetical protein